MDEKLEYIDSYNKNISKNFGFRNFHITAINLMDGKHCAFIAFMNED
jgi:hypothetical protein